jgi:hypothetical protein
MTDIEGGVRVAKTMVLVFFLAYLVLRLAIIFRLNSCLPKDRRIRYRLAFFSPRTFTRSVSESYYQQFPRGRQLTVARTLLLSTVWTLVAAIALDLLRIVVTP